MVKLLRRRSFTLVEVILMVVIIAILSAVAWPSYIKIKEKSLNREAKASLLLIRVLEKSYRMEYGYYYPYLANTSVIADINTNLKSRLPESATRSWTIGLNCASGPEFATATRTGTGADGRLWSINLAGDTDPTCSGGSYCS